jgi:pimeloyl-ACP methyl ester carboxylesterase
MGSSLSCNTCSIDRTINQLIFHPPQKVPEFNSHPQHISFDVQQRSGNIVHGMIVVPKVSLGRGVEAFSPNSKFLIFSHGNASDVFTMLPYATNLADVLNVQVVLYDYSGYGLSSGDCSEQNCYDCLTATVLYIKTTYNAEDGNILLVGQSLGTGVVVDYVAHCTWRQPIILISPYKSIGRVAVDSSIVTPLDKFESLKKIHRVICPVKIFHGESDELINISHGKELYGALNDRSLQPTWMHGVGHNDILDKIDLNEIARIINTM